MAVERRRKMTEEKMNLQEVVSEQAARRRINRRLRTHGEELSPKKRQKIKPENFKRKAELRITKKLLASKFSLGDGTEVTWGEATIAQHEQGIKLLWQNIIENLEAYARELGCLKPGEKLEVTRAARLRVS